MIKIYTSNSCHSCKKALDFLNKEHIPYIEKNISKVLLSNEEIKEMFVRAPNGADDVISKRSKVFKEKGIDVDTMTINELIEFVKENPTVLKRPIIYNDYTMVVGYNADDIDVFIPNKLKKFVCECGPDCPIVENNCYKEK